MKELHTLPDHLSSLPLFIGVHVAQSLIFLVVLFGSLFYLFVFLSFPLAIALSVLVRITAFGYISDISELFLLITLKVINKILSCTDHHHRHDRKNSTI